MKMINDVDYEYDEFPDKFTMSYLKNEDVSTFIEIDYDDEMESEKDSEYIEHFFQLNSWLKFSFRYYIKSKTISNIYIMDNEYDNGWYEFYELKILNDIMKEFDIVNNKFNWDFNFKKHIN